MVIQYCSDLHLEFPVNKRFLKNNPLIPSGEILLLGGDIVPLAIMDSEKDFFDFVSDNFEQTYWVPGNHEYYHSDINIKSGTLHEKIRKNVLLVNNVSVSHKHVRLIFSTLWSKISPAKEMIIQQYMADFHAIRNKDRKFTPHDYNLLHEECRKFITTELQTTQPLKTVVVTHHIPTFKNYPEKYKESDLNEGFAVELFDLISGSKADYWLFGHSHEVVPDFTVGNTILTNNQLGYVQHNEHLNFLRNKTLSIDP